MIDIPSGAINFFSDFNGVLEVGVHERTTPFPYNYVSFKGRLDKEMSSMLRYKKESISSYIISRVKKDKPIVFDFEEVVSLDSSGVALLFFIAGSTKYNRISIVHPRSGIQHHLEVACCSSKSLQERFPVFPHLVDFFDFNRNL